MKPIYPITQIQETRDQVTVCWNGGENPLPRKKFSKATAPSAPSNPIIYDHLSGKLLQERTPATRNAAVETVEVLSPDELLCFW